MEEYMKKYLRYGLIVGLASVFALSAFAGCGGGENESSPSSSDSTSGNSSSVEDTENYEGYFKKMTITSGDLLVYGRAENLSTEQQFLAESIQGLFAQKGESKYYHYRTGSYETWLSEIETEYGKKNRDVTLSEMLQDYKENIGTGYVLFDKSVSASVNCARSIAGVEGLAMIDISLKDWAEENGLVQRCDATTMSEEECFDTYKDKFDNSGLVQQNGSNIFLTDYAIACKYYC